MSGEKPLDLFGKKLMVDVRDRSINMFYKIADGSLKSKTDMKLHELLNEFTPSQIEVTKILMREIVDNLVFNTLNMVEQSNGEIRIIALGEDLAEISDGLAGELFSDDGWITKYSNYCDSDENEELIDTMLEAVSKDKKQ